MIRRVAFLVTLGIAVLVCPTFDGANGGAWAAQDLTLSAKVDKTSVDLGDPVNLTLTLSGDLTGVDVPALTFPEGFAVAARSQSTNFAIRAGVTERSMTLLYVLLPQREGTFKVGPFTVTQKKKTFQTAPIEIIVKKPALPPTLKSSPRERFTL